MRTRSVALSAGLLMAAVLWIVASGPAQAKTRGEVLFTLCAMCHGPNGGGNRLFLAPSIAGLDEWYVLRQLGNFRSGARGLHPDDVAGMRMRPMSLTLTSDEDVAAIAAYVAALPPVRPARTIHGGDAARGKGYFSLCVQCHGDRGQGNEQLGGPPTSRLDDWYLLKQLQNFRAGIRGASPQDVQGMLMRPMALTLPDEQAIKDVVAYIVTLPD